MRQLHNQIHYTFLLCFGFFLLLLWGIFSIVRMSTNQLCLTTLLKQSMYIAESMFNFRCNFAYIYCNLFVKCAVCNVTSSSNFVSTVEIYFQSLANSYFCNKTNDLWKINLISAISDVVPNIDTCRVMQKSTQ